MPLHRLHLGSDLEQVEEFLARFDDLINDADAEDAASPDASKSNTGKGVVE